MKLIHRYKYGSHVYGTNHYNSDIDYIDIVEGDFSDTREIRNGLINITTYSVEHWKKMIQEHKIFALECIFFDGFMKEQFLLDKEKLRHEISQKASNSYVKAKKKLMVEENQEYIGRKSLWHSLRIIMFGIQIAKFSTIIDFQEANYLYDDIVNTDKNFDELEEKYRLLYNKLMTQFRILAPKKV